MRNVMNFTSQHKCKRIVHPGEQNIGSFEVTESVRKRALRSTPKSQHSMTELKLNTNVCKCKGGDDARERTSLARSCAYHVLARNASASAIARVTASLRYYATLAPRSPATHL